MGSCLLLAGMGLVAMQVTNPADISGQWAGDNWQQVTLSSVDEAADWYTGSFTDSEGRRGALQLEWSRLQRRYNGRWKTMDGHSGAITLRPGNEGAVRGAIVLDPDAIVGANVPRLREFAWQRSRPANQANVKKQARTSPQAGADSAPWTSRSDAQRPPRPSTLILEAPEKGRLTLRDGLRENSHVKEDELIAEIIGVDEVHMNRLKAQLTATQQQFKAAKTVLDVSKKNVEAARATINACQSQVKAYEQVKQEIIAAADRAIISAQDKLKIEQQQLAITEAATHASQLELRRQESLHQKKLISEQSLEKAKASLLQARVQLQKSEAQVRSYENELAAKKSERSINEQRAQVDIDHAKASLAKAQADLATSQGEMDQSEADLSAHQRTTHDLEAKIARQSTYEIRSPFDGVVTSLSPKSESGQVLNKGETICVLTRSTAVPQSPPDAPAPREAQGSKSDNDRVVAGRPSAVTPIGLPTGAVHSPLLSAFGTASDLSRRFRQNRASLQAAENELASLQAKIASHDAELLPLEASLKRVGQGQPNADRPASNGERRAANIRKLRKADQAALDAIQVAVKERRAELEETEAEKSTILEILKVQLESATVRLKLQQDVAKAMRLRFEQGDETLDVVLKAERELAATTAEFRRLELLLKHYTKIGPSEAQPEPVGEAMLDHPIGLKAPASDKERIAIVKILAAQRESKIAQLEQAKHSLKRIQKLVSEGLVSQPEAVTAKTLVSQAEADVKELDIKIQYFESQPDK